MVRTKLSLKDFKHDPVRHIVMPLLIEFLSQFMMTFWGVMTEKPQAAVTAVIVTASNTTVPMSDYAMNTFVPAFQTGISVWACITLFSKMSYAPAQFNPSITITLVTVGTVPVLLLVPNIIIQLIASLFAAFLSQAIRGSPPPALIIPDEASSWSIFASEVILVACVTIFAAELTQNPKMDDPMGVFALGMAVFMAVLSGRWTGVVCLSPSRVFGPAVLTGGAAWNRHWLLWLADITGAVGAGVVWLTFLAPFDRSLIGRFAKKEYRKDDVLMEKRNGDEDNK